MSVFDQAGFDCRHCGAPLSLKLADLGALPIANDYVKPEHYNAVEPIYPLEVYVCRRCRFAQAREVRAHDSLFRADYAYYSSHSTSWLAHAEAYVGAMTARFGLGPHSRAVEIGCNDGYLLQFVKKRGIPCLGIEPTAGPAQAARAKGIETRVAFFGRETARALAAEGWRADLMPANNVLAHVPDINDFVGGAAELLAPEGVATFEVQHLLRLMQRMQFDTIYHEHYAYLSLIAARRIFASQGLRVFDVESLETHGGSIRFYVCRQDAGYETSLRVADLLAEEIAFGMEKDAIYEGWIEQVKEVKRSFLAMLIDLKRQGKSIAAYGAPAKGATLLNYCGVRTDLLDFTVDMAPSKQGRYLPGVRIPIYAPDHIFEAKPDYVVILPWNLAAEIMDQMAGVRAWGGRFIAPLPELRILD